MKTKIARPHYANLHNNEYPLAAERTISIAEKYDMQGMKLGRSFGILSSFRPRLQAMKVYIRKNKKIEAAGLLDSERDTLVKAFRGVVKAQVDVELPQVKPYCALLNELLDNHKTQTIAGDGLSTETERLNNLEKDIVAGQEIQAAITALNLQDIVARMFDANREYEALFREIIADKSVTEHIDIPVLRRECNKALGQFFDAIQYCAFEHEDIDYTGLVNEINQLNNYYRTQLKARATRRKNGKDTDKEDPIVPPAE